MQKADDVLREAMNAHLASDWQKAEFLYCRIIAHAEDHPTAYFLLGTLYAQALCPGRAITFLKQAIALDPNHYEAMQNLAGAYRQIEERDKSILWNERSLALNRNARILNNLAGCYVNQGAPQKALEYADEALALQPGFPEAGNHRALALLEMGRFEEGWKQYDSRMNCVGEQNANMMTKARFTRRPYTVPLWTGEPVKLLAIHGEQGLGDEIMFLTCVKQIREQYRVGEIVIEGAERLVKLLRHSLGCKVYPTHDILVKHEKPDAYIPMGSLPRFIWPVKPNAYLKPTTTYPKANRPRVGLSWFGGSQLTHDRLRNTLVEEWKPMLASWPSAEFISVQYGPRDDEAAVLGIPHDGSGIGDLDRLAAMLKSCDLIVSVCNTTIHMAGALGVPCLCLVPSAPAWRYGLTGKKMVWYDSVTLLRQKEGESWASVISRAGDWIADFGQLPRTQRAAA